MTNEAEIKKDVTAILASLDLMTERMEDMGDKAHSVMENLNVRLTALENASMGHATLTGKVCDRVDQLGSQLIEVQDRVYDDHRSPNFYRGIAGVTRQVGEGADYIGTFLRRWFVLFLTFFLLYSALGIGMLVYSDIADIPQSEWSPSAKFARRTIDWLDRLVK